MNISCIKVAVEDIPCHILALNLILSSFAYVNQEGSDGAARYPNSWKPTRRDKSWGVQRPWVSFRSIFAAVTSILSLSLQISIRVTRLCRRSVHQIRWSSLRSAWCWVLGWIKWRRTWRRISRIRCGGDCGKGILHCKRQPPDLC